MASTTTSDGPPFGPEVEIFSEFIQRFELQCLDLLQKARNDERRKIAILLKCLPVKIITDLQRRIKPVAIADTSYDDVVASLQHHHNLYVLDSSCTFWILVIMKVVSKM